MGNRNILCIYHDNCQDGIIAAAAVYEAYKDEDIAFLPYQYGKPFPLDKALNKEVIVVDFSFSPAEVARCVGHIQSIIQIDHHDSAIRAWDQSVVSEKVTNIFDENYSGAALAWNYFHLGNRELPKAVSLSQDYDLWKFNLFNTKAFVEWFCATPAFLERNVEKTAELIELFEGNSNFRTRALLEGKAMVKSKTAIISNILKRGVGEVEIEGRWVPCVNIPKEFTSVAGSILSKNKPFAMLFEYNLKDNVVVCSLRSHPTGEQVNTIAERFGGGGHPHAAGFSVSIEQFHQLFKFVNV